MLHACGVLGFFIALYTLFVFSNAPDVSSYYATSNNDAPESSNLQSAQYELPRILRASLSSMCVVAACDAEEEEENQPNQSSRLTSSREALFSIEDLQDGSKRVRIDIIISPPMESYSDSGEKETKKMKTSRENDDRYASRQDEQQRFDGDNEKSQENNSSSSFDRDVRK